MVLRPAEPQVSEDDHVARVGQVPRPHLPVHEGRPVRPPVRGQGRPRLDVGRQRRDRLRRGLQDVRGGRRHDRLPVQAEAIPRQEQHVIHDFFLKLFIFFLVPKHNQRAQWETISWPLADHGSIDL